MIIARPDVNAERRLVLTDRYAALRAASLQAGGTGGWKSTTWLGRCLGFALALLGVVLFAGVLSPFPSPWLVGGCVLMGAAEWLVATRRVFRSGVEEALYLCGAIAVVVQLLQWSDGDNTAAAVALVSLAVLLVGWRLLNPLFTTLAAAGVTLAVGLSGTHLFDGRLNTRAACAVSVVLALAGYLGSARLWRRPSHDRMCEGLVILMPWLAHGWLLAYGWHAGSAPLWSSLGLAAGFLLLNLWLGARWRTHAPLTGALGNLAGVAVSLHGLLAWPLHGKMMAAGACLLLVAWYVDRLLRHRRSGLTSAPLQESAAMDLAQMAGAAHLAPVSGGPPASGVQGQGGDFGGGGASGRF